MPPEDNRQNTPEMKKIFEQFDDCRSEYISRAEAAIFEYVFRLEARLTMETIQDTE